MTTPDEILSLRGALASAEYQVACKCGSSVFHIFYDGKAMSNNVRCSGCGTSIGDLR